MNGIRPNSSKPISVPEDIVEYAETFGIERELLTNLRFVNRGFGRGVYVEDMRYGKKVAAATDKQLNDPTFDLWAFLMGQLIYAGPSALDTLAKVRDEYCGGRF